MGGDSLGCIQIFRQQSWGHHQGISGVGEPFPRSAIDREFARRLQRFDAGDVPQRIRILGITESAEQHTPWIASVRLGLVFEKAANPLA